MPPPQLSRIHIDEKGIKKTVSNGNPELSSARPHDWPLVRLSPFPTGSPRNSQKNKVMKHNALGPWVQCAERRLAERENWRCAVHGFIDLGHTSRMAVQGIKVVTPGMWITPAKVLLGTSYLSPLLPALTTTCIFGPNIHAPKNAMFVNYHAHDGLATFRLWLKENHYSAWTADWILNNGQYEADIHFNGESPPDPTLLRIHAARASVLNGCGFLEIAETWEHNLLRTEASVLLLESKLRLLEVATS
ncbi:hypothetical protein DFH08DRAFT_828200 [Mycena albidolilacea]|uniref:Uncharacterized protein n=1 Tax=Mycena albidolilacea TaxID=1033008 RepID=A0AAD6YWU7_9AGAR|nr:hypothetical protein DFH08DRAFT_828200 [Mycena albidolilacea]